jgi:hypothetical protein
MKAVSARARTPHHDCSELTASGVAIREFDEGWRRGQPARRIGAIVPAALEMPLPAAMREHGNDTAVRR